MSGWALKLRSAVDRPVDASPIRLCDFAPLSRAELERVVVQVGGQPVALAEIFSITPLSGDEHRLVLEGDLSRFHHLADGHRGGEFRVEGSVGDYCGGTMTGGTLRIAGDAGDQLAAPSGARRSGTRGGRIIVGGSAGDYAGHRMRRGELFIEGDVGQFAAAHQVAGTIAVAGSLGAHAGYAMRRGTLIATRLPDLPPGRFSRPVLIRSVFASLIRLEPHGGEETRRLMERVAGGEFWLSRGDRAACGQGEVWAPSR